MSQVALAAVSHSASRTTSRSLVSSAVSSAGVPAQPLARPTSGLQPQVDRHRPLQLEQDRLHRQVELPVAGERDDRGVERAVRVVLGEFVAVVLARRPSRSSRARTSASGSAPAVAVQRQRRGDRVALQHRPDLEQLRMSSSDQTVTRRPAARQVLDQALLGEQPQRLPHRRPADREPLADLLFDQPRARLQGTAEDLVAQPAGGASTRLGARADRDRRGGPSRTSHLAPLARPHGEPSPRGHQCRCWGGVSRSVSTRSANATRQAAVFTSLQLASTAYHLPPSPARSPRPERRHRRSSTAPTCPSPAAWCRPAGRWWRRRTPAVHRRSSKPSLDGQRRPGLGAGVEAGALLLRVVGERVQGVAVGADHHLAEVARPGPAPRRDRPVPTRRSLPHPAPGFRGSRSAAAADSASPGGGARLAARSPLISLPSAASTNQTPPTPWPLVSPGAPSPA